MAPAIAGTEKTAEPAAQKDAGPVIGPAVGPLLGITIIVSLGPTPHPFVPFTIIVPVPLPTTAVRENVVLLPDHPVPNTVQE